MNVSGYSMESLRLKTVVIKRIIRITGIVLVVYSRIYPLSISALTLGGITGGTGKTIPVIM